MLPKVPLYAPRRRAYNSSHYKSLFVFPRSHPSFPFLARRDAYRTAATAQKTFRCCQRAPLFPVCLEPAAQARTSSAGARFGEFPIDFGGSVGTTGTCSPAYRDPDAFRDGCSLPLEGNRGGRARRVQCGAPYRHQHLEARVGCRNGECSGSRSRAQRRRETAGK